MRGKAEKRLLKGQGWRSNAWVRFDSRPWLPQARQTRGWALSLGPRGANVLCERCDLGLSLTEQRSQSVPLWMNRERRVIGWVERLWLARTRVTRTGLPTHDRPIWQGNQLRRFDRWGLDPSTRRRSKHTRAASPCAPTRRFHRVRPSASEARFRKGRARRCHRRPRPLSRPRPCGWMACITCAMIRQARTRAWTTTGVLLHIRCHPRSRVRVTKAHARSHLRAESRVISDRGTTVGSHTVVRDCRRTPPWRQTCRTASVA